MPSAIRIPSLRMTELDGSPDVQGVERIYLSSGFMSNLGGGSVLLSMSGTGGGSSVTIRDIDGAPTITPLNTLYVTNGFLSDLGSGNALLSLSGSGGGGGAPTTAEYIVGALDGTLSDERLVTNTATITWDLGTAGQAKANAASGEVLISETIVGGGGAATFTFSSIPSTYRHLRLYFLARTDNAAVQMLGLQFNGDTGANYDSQFLSATATTATAAESIGATSIGIAVCSASGAQAGAFATGTIDIPYYALTVNDKTAISQFILVSTTASGGVVSRYRQGSWRTASAVTSIVLTPAAGTLVQDSRCSLYGVF